MAAYPVVRVIDERHVCLRVDDKEQAVVLCGVTAPTSQVAREQLLRFLQNLLKGETVVVQYDPVLGDDSQDPRLAHLFRAPDGLFVNLEIVRQGYAKVQAKPVCEHLELLRQYERRAKQARKGVWAPQPRPEPVHKSAGLASPPITGTGQTMVYVTKSGKKYHRKDCQYLRKSSRAISLKEAVKKGYEPCSRCKPPILKNP